MDLTELRHRPLTYPQVGATRGDLPAGYHHLDVSARIGTGRDRFERAADAVMRWGMQRGAGLRVQPSSDVVEVDTVVLVRLGFLRAPCRVVYVVDDADCRGFGYGTLSGHPESGEESFMVRYDAAEDAVYAQARAFSRPAAWWARLGGPLTTAVARMTARRYLRGV